VAAELANRGDQEEVGIEGFIQNKGVLVRETGECSGKERERFGEKKT